MDDGPRTIGAIARESGLSVSALRFYDGAGVLRPSRVDPATGYRWYTADQVGPARLIAALRRVGMPIPDICELLAAQHDRIAAGRLLDQHLRRLEDGLSDARRQLDSARNLLGRPEDQLTTMTVRGNDLSAAFAAVRFAMSNDPELPALSGVLFDYDGDTLRLVASDRYRLAVSSVPAGRQHGPAVQVIAPRSLIDGCAPAADAEILVLLGPGSVQVGGTSSAGIDAVFPDYRRLLPARPLKPVAMTRADLRERLTAGPTRTLTQAPYDVPHEVSVVLFTGDTIEVLDRDHPDAAGFNREFLLEAIDAGQADQLVLALDGPITPLAIRRPDRPDDLSLLMPTRLS